MFADDFSRIVAGDAISVTTGVDGYSSDDGWSAKYRFLPRATGGTGTAFEIAGTSAADGEFLFAALPSVTSTYVPAEYSWVLVVTSGTDGGRAVPREGIATVLANLSTSTAAIDVRSPARIALADALAAFAAWDGVRRSYSIAGRSITFNSMQELRELIQFWKIEVAREENEERVARGLPDKRRVFVRYG